MPLVTEITLVATGSACPVNTSRVHAPRSVRRSMLVCVADRDPAQAMPAVPSAVQCDTDQMHTGYVTARPVATKVAMRLNAGQKAQPGGRRAAGSCLLEVR